MYIELQTPNDLQLYAQMLVYVASQLGVFIIRMSYVYIAYYQSILRGADWMQVTAKKLIQRSNRANHRRCKCITIMSTRDRKICTTLDTGIKYLYKENIYSSDVLRHMQRVIHVIKHNVKGLQYYKPNSQSSLSSSHHEWTMNGAISLQPCRPTHIHFLLDHKAAER
jgi:hypothetical protein